MLTDTKEQAATKDRMGFRKKTKQRTCGNCEFLSSETEGLMTNFFCELGKFYVKQLAIETCNEHRFQHED
jgi:hypothetical protein